MNQSEYQLYQRGYTGRSQKALKYRKLYFSSITQYLVPILEKYHEENFGSLTKDQMEQSMHSLRLAFTKFDSLLQAINPEATDSVNDDEPTETNDEKEIAG